MGFHKYLVLLLVILLFGVITCVCAQTDETIGTSEEPETPFSKQWATLGEKIKYTNTELVKLFNEGDAAGMAELFGEHDIIITPNGEIRRGRQEIENFCSDIIKNGGTELTFETINIFISDIQQENPDNYDYIAYEIGKYSYIEQGKITGGSYIHIRIHSRFCPWSP